MGWLLEEYESNLLMIIFVNFFLVDVLLVRNNVYSSGFNWIVEGYIEEEIV